MTKGIKKSENMLNKSKLTHNDMNATPDMTEANILNFSK